MGGGGGVVGGWGGGGGGGVGGGGVGGGGGGGGVQFMRGGVQFEIQLDFLFLTYSCPNEECGSYKFTSTKDGGEKSSLGTSWKGGSRRLVLFWFGKVHVCTPPLACQIFPVLFPLPT